MSIHSRQQARARRSQRVTEKYNHRLRETADKITTKQELGRISIGGRPMQPLHKTNENYLEDVSRAVDEKLPSGVSMDVEASIDATNKRNSILGVKLPLGFLSRHVAVLQYQSEIPETPVESTPPAVTLVA